MSKVMQDEKPYLVQNEFETREQHRIDVDVSGVTMGANCVVCGGKMQFEEGDIIFGEKWFHKMCSVQK